MDNYNDINNEDNIIRQEQPNGGSLSNGTDPQVVDDIAAKVNAAKSQNYDHSNDHIFNQSQNQMDENENSSNAKNEENSNQSIPKNEKAKSKNSNNLKNNAKQIIMDKLKKKMLAGLLANPIMIWIVFGIIVFMILLVIIAYIDFVGLGLSIGGGSDEKIITGTCEENDERCDEIVENWEEEYDYLGDIRLYSDLLQYCEEETNSTFGQKLKNLWQKIWNIDQEVMETSCDLVRVIESYVSKKEQSYNITLSRGLLISTLIWMYNDSSNIDATTMVDAEEGIEHENLKVNTSSPNEVLENIVKGGLITAKDIKALVEYMVYEEKYTYYNWEAAEPITDYSNCEVDPVTGTEFDCGQIIKYSCQKRMYENTTTRPQKYFMFLKYGGNSYEEILENGTSKNLWYVPSLKDGTIIQKKQKSNFSEDNIYDPATSYQEITSYNTALGVTSEECKIEGKAQESLPESGDKIKYEIDESSLSTALHAFPYKETIDTLAYKEVSESGKASVTVLGSNCKLNNLNLGDTPCGIEEKEISYFNGFVYKSFPGYEALDKEREVAPEDYDDESYKNLSDSIENIIKRIDDDEEFLNEIFGFYTTNNGDIGYYQGITESALCGFQSKKVRLYVCPCASNKSIIYNEFPGGASYIDGVYVANESISFEQYIYGTANAEVSGHFYTEYIESLKFNLILIKSYALSAEQSEKNGEIYYPVGSCCFQNYKDTSTLDDRYKSVLVSAYNTVKDVLLYKKGTQEPFQAQYRTSLQNATQRYAQEGYTYEQMLTAEDVLNFDKVDYSQAEFGKCSTILTGGGIYNGSVDTSWPFFPAGTDIHVGWDDLFLCRLNDGRPDFHAAVDLGVNGVVGTQVTCPIDGKVISSAYYDCGNGIVKVEGTIPGTSEKVVLQFTHMDRNIISNGSIVTANQTIIGYLASPANDRCSNGVHLDFKVYNSATRRYYNPSVFVAGILSGSTNIPQSTFINGYNGDGGPEGYDVCCTGREGDLPQC